MSHVSSKGVSIYFFWAKSRYVRFSECGRKAESQFPNPVLMHLQRAVMDQQSGTLRGMFDSEERLDLFLAAFEAGVLPKCDWNHAAHLAVATCYLLSYSEEESLTRLRKHIRYLNDCHGTVNSLDSGYHETLTRFWLKILRRFLNTIPDPVLRLEAVNRVVAGYAQSKNLCAEYYSFDVVKSRKARVSWIPPDLTTFE